ncbi:kinetochore Sim4 complex subunit Fta4 [Xylaria cf. heliscus]|nr:kinetochore Sim4 complex subunit Fta4 [Xylaria cf. heliscus]
MAPPTIIAHKSTFLATQTLHLSQALAPSPTWRAANDRADDGVPARATDDALYRLNHVLSQHSRRVYAPQASRLVAEQIEGLFYAETQRALRGSEEEDNEGHADADVVERERLRIGADFTTAEAISSLPPTWDLHKPQEATSHPLEARRYAELTSTLTTLSTKRQEALERVARLRRMAALLAPFESAASPSSPDPKVAITTTTTTTTTTSVQENLVTRNGEIERELERMRLLLARVAGRVARLPSKGAGDNNDDDDEESTDLDAVEREKVGKLLDHL